jgi:hypothetical protein
MGMDPDPRIADTYALQDHEHDALVYEANPDPELVGQPVFSEFPRQRSYPLELEERKR